jgi:hypothetical protein
MNKPTLERIIEVSKALNFKVFTDPFDVNLGFIRTLDNEAETFNDWLFAYYRDKNNKLIGEVVAGTCDAGMYYRINPINKKGTAIIQHGVQHKKVYQLQDPKLNKSLPGHKGQKAFRQIRPMAYWRDNNKNVKLDFKGEVFMENGATNGHYMGTVGKKVGTWSAGCWGTTVKELDKIFAIAQVQIDNKLGDVFSLTALHEEHFKR